MRKWCAFLAMYFLLCSLAACASGTPETPQDTNTSVRMEESRAMEKAAVTMVCRIVDGGGTDTLLLAGQSDAVHDVYALPLTEKLGDAASFRDGDLIEVGYSGSVLETFPAQLEDVCALEVQSEGFDDRCTLYLQVLEDLWKTDAALNEGITQMGVDLSQTSLSGSEQSAVAWAFGQRHGLEVVQGTWAELQEQGYFSGAEGWQDGCWFSIEEQSGTDDGTVTFGAEKWRSGDGADFFHNCTASQSKDGHWRDYEVGLYAIS